MICSGVWRRRFIESSCPSGRSDSHIRWTNPKGSGHLAAMLSDDAMRALAAESEIALVEFVAPSGEIVMPMDAHIVTASKG